MTSTFLKRFIIVLVSVLIVVGLTYEFSNLPDCNITNIEDAKETFSSYINGIKKISEPSGVSYRKIEEDVDEYGSYHMGIEAFWKTGESLLINLDYTPNDSPWYLIYFNSKAFSNWESCCLDLGQYDYVFEVMEYLCDKRYSAEKFRSRSQKLQREVERRRDDGETLCIEESSHFNSLFQSIGMLFYTIEEKDYVYDAVSDRYYADTVGYYAQVSIVMDLYAM